MADEGGGNIIQRIIKLILDRDSAKKAQDEMDSVTQHVESGWKQAAERIAEFLGLAFVVEKIKAFGEESVKAAAESEATWRQLAGTINATGASFDAMSEKLNETADAFQNASVHSRDDYAKTLQTLIVRTGDVAASTNNMALVSNVAAAFFKGELEPAANLVAKAMNGNIVQLQRMGIHAKDAQEALSILAARSMHATTIEAGTMEGQMKQLNVQWDEFKKDVGFAILGAGGAGSALGVLRSAIETLSKWVKDNKGEIQEWVTGGVKFAIDATDVLIRALLLVSDTLMTVVYSAFSGSADAILYFLNAYSALNRIVIAGKLLAHEDAAEWINQQVQIDGATKKLEAFSKAADQLAQDRAKRVVKDLTVPLFDSSQFSAPPKPGALPGENNKPQVGSNLSDANSKAVEKAIDEFKKAAAAADEMQKVLGDRFDAVGAEIDRTTKLFTVLTGQGIDPANVGFAGLGARLRDLVVNIKPTTDAARDLAKQLNTDLHIGLLTASTGMDTATTATDSLKKRQADILNTYKKLLDEGVDPLSAGMVDLTEQYQAYTVAIENQAPIDALAAANRKLAESFRVDFAQSVIFGAKSIDELTSSLNLLKKEQGDLENQITDLITKKVDPESEGFKRLVAQLRALQAVISDKENLIAIRDWTAALNADLAVAVSKNATQLEQLTIQQDALAKRIKAIGIPATKELAKELDDLKKKYDEVTAAIQKQTTMMQFQAGVADFLADALGVALQGGIAQAAKTKAKQNAIEAAEMTVRAGVYALFGDFFHAHEAILAAAGFTALAIAWGGLSASAGGGGGSGAPVSAPVIGGSPPSTGGTDLGTSRSASAASASGSQTAPADVNIYLVGPGFDAMNPRVQEVVYGAAQQATERFGSGTRIRIRPNGGN